MTSFLEVAGWTITQENSCCQLGDAQLTRNPTVTAQECASDYGHGGMAHLMQGWKVVHWWHGETRLLLKMTHFQTKSSWSWMMDRLRPATILGTTVVGQWDLLNGRTEESQSDRFLWNHGFQAVQTECKTAKIGLGRVELYEEDFLSWFHGVTVSSHSGVILQAYEGTMDFWDFCTAYGHLLQIVVVTRSDGVTESVSMQSSPNTPHWNWNDYTVTTTNMSRDMAFFGGFLGRPFYGRGQKSGRLAVRWWHWCVSESTDDDLLIFYDFLNLYIPIYRLHLVIGLNWI